MDWPVASRGSFKDEGQKLKVCEENLRRYHQLAMAGRLVGATMHEVNNRHGGTIQYRSSSVVGRSGTIFRVSLPTQSLARTPSPEESYVVDIGKKTRTVVP